jgi:hypothetical protein
MEGPEGACGGWTHVAPARFAYAGRGTILPHSFQEQELRADAAEVTTINIQPLACTSAAHYIREVLGLPPDRYITRFVQATQASVDLGRQVSASLKEPRYLHIAAVGPMTEPGKVP